MQITDVTVHPVENGHDRLLGYASVVFDGEFVVHNLRLVRTEDRFIVAMPNEKYKGEFRDIAHPVKQEARTRIEKAVVETYNRCVSGERQIELNTR